MALLDSGITNNQALSLSFDFINNKDEALDDYGHGSNVASLLLKNEHVAIYNAKVLNEDGSGKVDDVVDALNWADTNNVDIINMSFGFTENYPQLKATIDFITDKNIIIVSAAGNNIFGQTEYPAKYANVISVGALNNNKKSFFNSTKEVDIYAEAKNIETMNNKGHKEEISGTSVATAKITSYISKGIIEGKLAKRSSKKAILVYLKENYSDVK